MITDHRRNLGRVKRIETLSNLQICPRPSQTIGDIYDFEFSLVGKIWDNRKAVKSPIVWDFPDIWKPGLQKKKLCTWSTLFISLPLFCTTTTRETSENRLTYTFQGRNVTRFLVHFFFSASHFHLGLVAASISHFVTAAAKFSCCPSNKKMSPLFLSLALNLCRPFSRWASLVCRLLSLFLCLSLVLYSKFVDSQLI